MSLNYFIDFPLLIEEKKSWGNKSRGMVAVEENS